MRGTPTRPLTSAICARSCSERVWIRFDAQLMRGVLESWERRTRSMFHQLMPHLPRGLDTEQKLQFHPFLAPAQCSARELASYLLHNEGMAIPPTNCLSLSHAFRFGGEDADEKLTEMSPQPADRYRNESFSCEKWCSLLKDRRRITNVTIFKMSDSSFPPWQLPMLCDRSFQFGMSWDF